MNAVRSRLEGVHGPAHPRIAEAETGMPQTPGARLRGALPNGAAQKRAAAQTGR